MAIQLSIPGMGLGTFEQQIFTELRPIPSCPGYLAGNDGSIWSSHRNTLHELKVREDKDGYLRLNLSVHGERRCRHVHSLVAEAFIRPIQKGREEVNHLNAVKGDNKRTNLEITTRKGNAQHAYRLGLLFPIGAWNAMRSRAKADKKLV